MGLWRQADLLALNLIGHREPVVFFELGGGHSIEGEWHGSIYGPSERFSTSFCPATLADVRPSLTLSFLIFSSGGSYFYLVAMN